MVPDALAGAIVTLQDEIAEHLQTDDFAKGWTQAYVMFAAARRRCQKARSLVLRSDAATRERHAVILGGE